MQDAIQSTKAEFLQAKAGLLHAVSTTPDDRLNWSPSPSSRSVLHQVVHAAQSIYNIHGFLDGRPFPVPTPEETDRICREYESGFTRREEALSLFERNSDAFVAFLEALEPDRLSVLVTTPFGMGDFPTEVAIKFPAMHTRLHHAQIDYIQTIYGDRDWHMQG
jgi:hypothetical protein